MDQIPTKFLKEATDVLAYPLIETIYSLVKLSIFPEECKIVKVNTLS